MRRSYEYKQEGYIVQERGSWCLPYREVPSPISHKMVHKPSFPHSTPSYDVAFGGTRGWCGTNRLGNGVTLKKNEHHALGAKPVLLAPLGSVSPPDHHQQYTVYDGSEHTGWNRDEGQYFRGEGSTRQSVSMMVNNKDNENNNWMEASRKFGDHDHDWMEASRKFGDYGNNNWMEASGDYHHSSHNDNWMEASKKFGNYNHNGRSLEEELESLVKELRGSRLDGQVVKKIEVFEYERRSSTYGIGGVRVRQHPYPL